MEKNLKLNNRDIILVGGKRRSGKDYFTSLIKQTSEYGYNHFSFGKAIKDYTYDMLELSFEDGENLKNKDDGIILISKTKLEKNYNTLIDKVIKDCDYNYDYDRNGIVQFLNVEVEFDKVLYNISSNTGSEYNDLIQVNVRLALQYISSSLKNIFDDKLIWTRIVYNKIMDNNCVDSDQDIIISDFRFPFEDFRNFDVSMFNIVTIKVIGKNQYDFDPLVDAHETETALNDYKFDFIINNTAYSDTSLLAQYDAIQNDLCLRKV